MRILIIHNRYQHAGGEDVVFASECELLTRQGHDVDQLVFDNSTIRTGFDVIMSGLKAIYNPASAKTLRDRIRQFNPDIIHVHNFLPIGSPSILWAAKEFQLPVVMTLHNYRLLCPSATLFYDGGIYEGSLGSRFPWGSIWKGVYRDSRIQTAAVALMVALHRIVGTWRSKVDAYIALTEFARTKFQHRCSPIPVDRLLVKPNFVRDCGRGYLKREDQFLFVGRLTEEKGISTLLRAAREGGFRLLIAGDGPLRVEVELAASFYPNIVYLGHIDRSSVMQHLKRSTALIFPSEWYEGFPMTLLEAFSTCTPVIASRLGSMIEIVKEGYNGLLMEPGSSEELANCVNRLRNDEHLRRRLAENARLSYVDHYSPAKNYVRLMAIYEGAIESVAPRRRSPFVMPRMMRYPIPALDASTT